MKKFPNLVFFMPLGSKSGLSVEMGKAGAQRWSHPGLPNPNGAPRTVSARFKTLREAEPTTQACPATALTNAEAQNEGRLKHIQG